MNNCMRRFLAVNCVLNGHHLMEAFDSDTGIASHALGISDKDSLELDKSLYELCSVKAERDALVYTVLNFMRTHQYAFITPGGGETIMLRTAKESDLKGEVSKEVRAAILNQIIRKVVVSSNSSADNIMIADGVLYVPEGATLELVKAAISRAYRLYRDGPCNGEGLIMKYRNNLTVNGYKPFSAKVCLAIFKDFLQRGISPVDYRDTALLVPDMLLVYKKTGCILSTAETQSSAADWLLEVEGDDKAKHVIVDYSVLRSLIVQTAKELANIVYSNSEADNHLKIRTEG